MNETFKAYFARLEGLSAEELDSSTVDLVRSETRQVARVIAHIAEISRRKVELGRGYQNLFDYCVRRLGLSEGSVTLRIQVANVARRYPQTLACLAEGKIRLSVLGRLAPHLRAENVEDLLRDDRVVLTADGPVESPFVADPACGGVMELEGLQS